MDLGFLLGCLGNVNVKRVLLRIIRPNIVHLLVSSKKKVSSTRLSLLSPPFWPPILLALLLRKGVDMFGYAISNSCRLDHYQKWIVVSTRGGLTYCLIEDKRRSLEMIMSQRVELEFAL